MNSGLFVCLAKWGTLSTLKKGNRYLVVQCENNWFKLQLKDTLSYIPKSNLKTFLSSNSSAKGDQKFDPIPFSALKSERDLSMPLPKYESYHDLVMGFNTLNYEYYLFGLALKHFEGDRKKALCFLRLKTEPEPGIIKYLQMRQSWYSLGLHTFRDLIGHYCVMDCQPLLGLMCKIQQKWRYDMYIDIYLDYISLSGAVLRYAIRSVSADVRIRTETEEVSLTLRDGLYGGIFFCSSEYSEINIVYFVRTNGDVFEAYDGRYEAQGRLAIATMFNLILYQFF
jgi:hypothetical protein